MSELITITAIAIGFPTAVIMTFALRGWCLKVKELKYKQEQLKLDARLKTDELNTKMFHMDDSFSTAQLASLSDEVRRLREEVAQLKQEINSRIIN